MAENRVYLRFGVKDSEAVQQVFKTLKVDGEASFKAIEKGGDGAVQALKRVGAQTQQFRDQAADLARQERSQAEQRRRTARDEFQAVQAAAQKKKQAAQDELEAARDVLQARKEALATLRQEGAAPGDVDAARAGVGDASAQVSAKERKLKQIRRLTREQVEEAQRVAEAERRAAADIADAASAAYDAKAREARQASQIVRATLAQEQALIRTQANEARLLHADQVKQRQLASRGERQGRAALVNLGQQAQDVAVQLQMGTAYATIFAQQVPQALAGIGGGVTLAIVAGLAAVSGALYTLIGGANDAEAAMDRLADAGDRLKNSLSGGAESAAELRGLLSRMTPDERTLQVAIERDDIAAITKELEVQRGELAKLIGSYEDAAEAAGGLVASQAIAARRDPALAERFGQLEGARLIPEIIRISDALKRGEISAQQASLAIANLDDEVRGSTGNLPPLYSNIIKTAKEIATLSEEATKAQGRLDAALNPPGLPPSLAIGLGNETLENLRHLEQSKKEFQDYLVTMEALKRLQDQLLGIEDPRAAFIKQAVDTLGETALQEDVDEAERLANAIYNRREAKEAEAEADRKRIALFKEIEQIEEQARESAERDAEAIKRANEQRLEQIRQLREALEDLQPASFVDRIQRAGDRAVRELGPQASDDQKAEVRGLAEQRERLKLFGDLATAEEDFFQQASRDAETLAQKDEQRRKALEQIKLEILEITDAQAAYIKRAAVTLDLPENDSLTLQLASLEQERDRAQEAQSEAKRAQSEAEALAKRRKEAAEEAGFEAAALETLAKAYLDDAEAVREAENARERASILRRVELDLTTEQGRALDALLRKQQEAARLVEQSTAQAALRLQREETKALVEVLGQGADAYRALQREQEALREAEAAGFDRDSPEGRAFAAEQQRAAQNQLRLDSAAAIRQEMDDLHVLRLALDESHDAYEDQQDVLAVLNDLRGRGIDLTTKEGQALAQSEITLRQTADALKEVAAAKAEIERLDREELGRERVRAARESGGRRAATVEQARVEAEERFRDLKETDPKQYKENVERAVREAIRQAAESEAKRFAELLTRPFEQALGNIQTRVTQAATELRTGGLDFKDLLNDGADIMVTASDEFVGSLLTLPFDAMANNLQDSVEVALKDAFENGFSPETIKEIATNPAFTAAIGTYIGGAISSSLGGDDQAAALGGTIGSLIVGAIGAYFGAGNPYAIAAGAAVGGTAGSITGGFLGGGPARDNQEVIVNFGTRTADLIGSSNAANAELSRRIGDSVVDFGKAVAALGGSLTSGVKFNVNNENAPFVGGQVERFVIQELTRFTDPILETIRRNSGAQTFGELNQALAFGEQYKVLAVRGGELAKALQGLEAEFRPAIVTAKQFGLAVEPLEENLRKAQRALTLQGFAEVFSFIGNDIEAGFAQLKTNVENARDTARSLGRADLLGPIQESFERQARALRLGAFREVFSFIGDDLEASFADLKAGAERARAVARSIGRTDLFGEIQEALERQVARLALEARAAGFSERASAETFFGNDLTARLLENAAASDRMTQSLLEAGYTQDEIARRFMEQQGEIAKAFLAPVRDFKEQIAANDNTLNPFLRQMDEMTEKWREAADVLQQAGYALGDFGDYLKRGLNQILREAREAVDEQEQGVRDQADAIRSFFESTYGGIRKMLDDLQGGALATDNPERLAASALRTFRETELAARGGDTAAVGRLADAARAALEANKAFSGGGGNFEIIRDEITRGLRNASEAGFRSERSTLELIPAGLRTQTDKLEELRAETRRQTDELGRLMRRVAEVEERTASELQNLNRRLAGNDRVQQRRLG